jgi:hypothetical protein
MKQFSLTFLLFAFVLGMVTVPDSALAKRGGDDDSDWSEYSIEDEDEDEDEDVDENEDEDESVDSLEVEADVYTDTTIVKVELRNNNKTVFTTEADTQAEVVDVVAARFDLTKAEVEAVLDFEIEDRASRTSERAKISNQNNRPVKVCATSTISVLEVEADIFTNTTIVKVEKNGTTTVFETVATTTDAIADAVVAKVASLTVAEVKAVLDIDVEDRASRVSDFVVSSSSNDDDCESDLNGHNNSNNNATSSDTELRNRINELQRLLETLIKLFSARFGN